MRGFPRRDFLKLAGLGATAWACPGALRAAEAERKNVLFIAIDDLNHWVGYLHRNDQTRTPNIDRLAARGVAFQHAYCAAPVCNPSRAALMSGLRPNVSGVYENNNDWRTVITEDKPLTSAFHKAGYAVSGAGKIYHESFARDSEWDEYLHHGELPADPRTKAKGGVGGIRFAPLDCKDEDLRDYQITDWVIKRLKKGFDKPFFLACGLQLPHMTWAVPQPWFDRFPLADIKLPPYQENDLDDIPPAGVRMAKPDGDHAAMLKSGRWKDAVQAYLAACAYTDMNVGRLIEALDASPYRDNTIVVLWGDHGWHLGEKHHWRKFALWEEATRAPLVWVAPGVTKPGGDCKRTVDFMSIYPTLCDLCGIEKPGHVVDPSIRKLLEDPDAAWDRPALTTYKFMNHAVRSEEWRYIRYANGDEELYHDSDDPYEWTNVVGKPEQAAVKTELAKWMPEKNQPDIGSQEGGKGKGKKNKKAFRDEDEQL